MNFDKPIVLTLEDRSIDIGPGERGPITKQLQDAFFGLFSGETEDTDGWLEAVQAPDVAAASGG